MDVDVLVFLVYGSLSEAWISTNKQVGNLPLLILPDSTAIFPLLNAVLFLLIILFIV
uniref:Uncharacterized protein n=1 Tax=Amphimedon queenslandica TaxID=400682 RepID=A0A1X7TF52_AMPQE